MDGKIVEVMKALQTYLKANLPALKGVMFAPGAFNDEAVNRLITNSGTVHLSFLGLRQTEQMAGGHQYIQAAFGAYVAASGQKEPQFAAINVLEAVAAVLSSAGNGDDAGLGVTYALEPVIGTIENLYTKETAKRGVALYGMTFAVPIVIGAAVFEGDLDTWNQIINMAGLDGTDTPIELDFDNDERVEAVDGEP